MSDELLDFLFLVCLLKLILDILYVIAELFDQLD
jgi:hypothetical protein